MPTDKSDEGNSPAEILFSQACLSLCQVDKEYDISKSLNLNIYHPYPLGPLKESKDLTGN